MKAKEVLEHFLGIADWVDKENTVDRIITGDPEKDTNNILVTLYPDINAVKYAVDNGFDLIMTHEPTFWSHINDVENLLALKDTSFRKKTGIAKKKYIEHSGLVILRNHDVWDRMPEIGIPWAWAEFLGFDGKPAAIGAVGYQHRYDIESVALDALAGNIAKRSAALGEQSVQVIGDGERIISKVGIGTGCACGLEAFLEMGCDAAIVSDDGCCYWRDIKWAMDMGFPIIRVNHATSEEPGMVKLTDYINKNLQGVKAVHLPHKCKIRLIS